MAFGIATCGRFGSLLAGTGFAIVLNAILAEDKVFARNNFFSCFERWRYRLLFALKHTFFISSFSLQGSQILRYALPWDNKSTGKIKATFSGCC